MTTHLWADDLTGAAELADAVRLLSGSACVSLSAAPTGLRSTSADVIVDLDLRHLRPEDAYHRLDAALTRISPADGIAYKIDSQLHGPIDAYIAAFNAHGRRPAFCAVNPQTGRFTVDGVHHVPSPSGTATTDIRSLIGSVGGTVGGSGIGGTAVLFDGADDEDLRRAARAARDVDAMGSAAFLDAWLTERAHARADARTSALASDAASAPHSPRRVLVIAGSTEPIVDEQIADLTTAVAATTVAVAPLGDDGSRRDPSAADLLAAIDRGPVTVLRAAPERLDAAASVLAEVIATTPPTDLALVLTGGHTARRVLEGARIAMLHALPSVVRGIACFVDPSGRRIFTKPGSYGTASSLSLLAQSVLATTHLEPR